MSGEGTKSGWTARDPDDWRTVREFLQANQYEQAAELLRQAQVSSARKGDTVLAETLAAAYQICLASGQCRAEVERYRRICKEAAQRENELRQQLHAILDQISRRSEAATRENGESAANISPNLVNPLERVNSHSVECHSLWQRIQSLLGWGASRRALQDETHNVSAQVSTPTSIAQVEEATVHPTAPESAAAKVSSVEKVKQKERSSPSLAIYCLGPFRVYQDDQPVKDWPSSKGKCIFKYLVTHRERPIAKEVLMELFWPSAHPDAARNNLNVAIYGLRQALRQTRPSFSHVLFQDDCYLLNPEMQIWIDREAFTEHLAAGQNLEQHGDLATAMHEYRAAEALYQGEFLEEDRYEDWLLPQRQRLQDDYLGVLDCLSRYYSDQADYAACVTVCRKMLTVDPCREEAHRQLMRCYSWQGQYYLALRQYHLCAERLREELETAPAPATTQLYECICHRDPV